MSVDLHVHSSASDGTVMPAELPAMAAAAGLSALALTDHDTVDGLEKFLARQQEFPDVELIGGVELSSSCGARELHIVGLFIDHKNRQLLDFLQCMKAERIARAEAMISKLRTLNYQVSWDDLAEAGMTGDVPGRPHFAQVLVKKYNFPDTKSVFDRLLKRGCGGFVPRQLPPPEDVIKIIKAAGGTAVWAHPFSSRSNENNFISRTIRTLQDHGLDAIEAYYSEYTDTKTATALRMAKEYHLAVSGGSDFHGSIHPDIQLGCGRGNLHVPDSVLSELLETRRPKVVIV